MLQSDTHRREGGQSVLLDDQKLALHAVIQSTAPHLCLLPLTPPSSYLCHPSPPLPTLCSIFRIFLNYLLLPSLRPLFLPPPLSSCLSCCLSPAVLTHPSFFCIFSLLLSLSHCLGRCRLFSISAPLLQINGLICRNKQVSSTPGVIPFPSCPEHVTERAE